MSGEGNFFIGDDDEDDTNDIIDKVEGKVEICESTVKTNGKMETIQEISNDNQNAEIDVRQRRDFLKKYGKESRHNVISRKDNLVLSPDQPPRIEEDNEVKFELPTKFHNYIKVVSK